MRVIDKICNLLATLAGVYLVAIMFAIVIQATLRSFNLTGSSHIFTFIDAITKKISLNTSNNLLNDLSVTQQIKLIKDFIVMVKI